MSSADNDDNVCAECIKHEFRYEALEVERDYWQQKVNTNAWCCAVLLLMCFVCFFCGSFSAATRERLRQRERSDVQHESMGDESPRDQRTQTADR